MTFREVNAYIEGKRETEIERSKSLRMVAWVFAQTNSKKTLRPHDLYLIAGEDDVSGLRQRARVSKLEHEALFNQYKRIKGNLGNGSRDKQHRISVSHKNFG